MKAKSMITMILFLALLLGLSGIVSAQITRITDNMYEDSFPQTAGGYVVWQARIDGDWEIFLYNANDDTGRIQITNNTYDDILPNTDGKYVTWAAGSAPYGEIFIYDIYTSITTQLTFNNAFDANPKVFNGLVVWVSNPIGYTLEPGDIFLYDIANDTIKNVSELVDPDNIYDDNAFRFDGQQILWNQEDDQGNSLTYLYDLTTDSIYLWVQEDDLEIIVPYLYDLTTGATYQKPEGLTLQDNPQVDGDLLVFTSMIDGDREIVLRDRKGKRGGPITANDIEDSQPSISGNILAWKGGNGRDAEIYIYEIPPFYADAGADLYLGIELVSQTVLQGVVEGETDALEYRWMMDNKELTPWQPVVNGGAPLALAPHSSELGVGIYTFVLEVTDGNITVNDQMLLNIENWYLTLINPDDEFKFQINEFPVFSWESKGYIQFKIQFSNEASFEAEHIRTFPQSDDTWLYETSITLEKWQAGQLIGLSKGPNPLYWRVLAQDRYGNEKISQTRRVFVETKGTM